MKAGVVLFPGANCDRDCLDAWKSSTGCAAEFLWHRDPIPPGFDLIILPGGFTYGDALRAGALARFSQIMDGVVEFAEQGGLVLGICNGFQILLECGLLPGAMQQNVNLRFVSKWQNLRVERKDTAFSRLFEEKEVIRMPIAHHQGNLYLDEQDLGVVERGNQVVFRYCDQQGQLPTKANPNGSVNHIAGLCNRRGNVLGLMPHPDRCWDGRIRGTAGVRMFRSLLQ